MPATANGHLPAEPDDDMNVGHNHNPRELEHMTAGNLIALLRQIPGDTVVLLSRDAEGNGFRPVLELGLAAARPDAAWPAVTEEYQLVADETPGATDYLVIFPR